MQMRDAQLRRDFRLSIANFGRRGRSAKDSAADYAEIKSAAANYQRISPARRDILDSRTSKLRELRHVERLIGIAHIYKMMRYAPAIFRRRFRRAEIHPAVKLARVGVDYLAVRALCHFHRECRLAGSGRSDNKANRYPRRTRPLRDFCRRQNTHRRNIRSICPRAN
jgi:hypothetical protein